MPTQRALDDEVYFATNPARLFRVRPAQDGELDSWGTPVGWLLQIICWATLFQLVSMFRWEVLYAVAIMWFISGWIARTTERRLYGTRDTLETIVAGVERYGRGDAASRERLLRHFAPGWWMRLMSPGWQAELERELQTPSGDALRSDRT